MKNRILSLVLLLLLAFTLCGCGGTEPAEWIPVRGAEQTRDISRENQTEALGTTAPAFAETIAISTEAITTESVSASAPSPSPETASASSFTEVSSETSSPAATQQTETAPEPVSEAAPETETSAPLPDRANPTQTEAPEPEPETEPEPEAQVRYIANIKTKKFHTPSCSSVTDMKEGNKLYFTGSREELIAQGYEPCKRCKP